MGIRIDPLNLSESHYVGEWFNFAQFKDSICEMELLVILLPLSGCFDNAVGEAEADDDRDDSTHADESREMFSVGGMINDNTTGEDRSIRIITCSRCTDNMERL